MKKMFVVLVTSTILTSANIANAYVIDGFLDDWGINLALANNRFYLDTHLPSGGLDIDVKTEDNADKYMLWTQVYPGWSWYNHFDAEAIYFDNDANNAYIAIVTGLRKEGIDPPGNTVNGDPYYVFRPGDIGISVDGDNIFEYGLKISDSKLYSVQNWKDAIYTWADNPNDSYNPWVINEVYNSGNLVNFVYSAEQNYHYVLEASIPLNYLGLSANPGDPVSPIKIHWTMECGNDYLNLAADVNPANPIPEPGTLLLFGAGIFGIFATTLRRFFRQIKRGMDFILSTLIVILAAPLGLMIAILIKMTSKGPVLIKQERVGENRRLVERRKENRGSNRRIFKAYGRPFIMYKFRTMYVGAEKETGPVWAQDNDPRVTKVGQFLRKTHLDELPQLINVIKGEMSIIGPRPERPAIVENLNKEIKRYNRRLRVKPGITGLAQVRQHYDTSLKDVKRKVHYDLLYIRRMCLMMDLRIIAGTFVVMLTGKGAR